MTLSGGHNINVATNPFDQSPTRSVREENPRKPFLIIKLLDWILTSVCQFMHAGSDKHTKKCRVFTSVLQISRYFQGVGIFSL